MPGHCRGTVASEKGNCRVCRGARSRFAEKPPNPARPSHRHGRRSNVRAKNKLAPGRNRHEARYEQPVGGGRTRLGVIPRRAGRQSGRALSTQNANIRLPSMWHFACHMALRHPFADVSKVSYRQKAAPTVHSPQRRLRLQSRLRRKA